MFGVIEYLYAKLPLVIVISTRETVPSLSEVVITVRLYFLEYFEELRVTVGGWFATTGAS